MTVAFEWGDTLPQLSAKRLILGPLTTADAADIYSVFGDPDVMKFWSSPPMESPDDARKYIDEIRQLFAARSLFQWGIRLRDSGQVIGTCTIHRLDAENRRAELGIILGRSAWGKGLATEALETLIGFAFDQLDLHRLEADIDPRNEGSLRLFERQAFQREGLLRERWHLFGEVQDTVLLGLLRREWPGGTE
jgi:RimJ/RimL family protein N-acetyltransferase